MADPAIQTFCCLRFNKKSSPAYHTLMEFNSTPYNVICLVSSVIGILGAASQRRMLTQETLHDRSDSILYILAAILIFPSH